MIEILESVPILETKFPYNLSNEIIEKIKILADSNNIELEILSINYSYDKFI